MKINDEIKSEYPWGENREWKKRTMAIAQIIPDGTSVLDLGGGFGNLTKYFSGVYLSVDKRPWTDLTVVADFNKEEFPDIGTFNYLVAQGIMEYIEKPKEFLESIKKYGDILIITCRLDIMKMEKNQFISLLNEAKWKVVFGKYFSRLEVIFYCRKEV